MKPVWHSLLRSKLRPGSRWLIYFFAVKLRTKFVSIEAQNAIHILYVSSCSPSPIEHEAGAFRNVTSWRLCVWSCEKCWQFELYRRMNNPFIQLFSGYPLFLGQKRHVASVIGCFSCTLLRLCEDGCRIQSGFQLVSFHTCFWRAAKIIAEEKGLNYLETQSFVVLWIGMYFISIHSIPSRLEKSLAGR